MKNTDIISPKNNSKNSDEKMSIIIRLKNLFFHPSNLISYIENNPNVMFPILFIWIFNIGAVAIEFNNFKSAVKDMLLAQLQYNESSITDGVVKIAVFISPLFSIFTILFSILITTSIFFIFVKVLKGKGYFKQYLSLITYSSIINLIGLILLMINSIFTGKFLLSADVTIFEILNIKLASNYFYGILSYFTISNILNIWQYLLIAIGIAKISKINKKDVYLFTFCIYIASILLNH